MAALDFNQVEKNLEHILSLIKSDLPIFPIAIMTAKSKGQLVVKDKDEMLVKFSSSGFLDCRVNAYPIYCGYNGLNKTSKVMVMIDLDLASFKKYKNPGVELDKSLKNTIYKLNHEINSNPLVLWTGGGYHIYQPIFFEEMLLSHGFNKYAQELNQNITNLFMRFAKDYFTDNKADPNHNPSIKSCLLRIPETINSKYRNIVTIIQKGDGESIQLDNIQDVKEKGQGHVLAKFEDWLIQQKINKKNQEIRLLERQSSIIHSKGIEIKWVERLLHTPIDDNRHYCLWRILIPYIVNIKGIDNYDEIYNVLVKWLDMCNELRRLSFEPKSRIKSILKSVNEYPPISANTLKKDNVGFYNTLKIKGCFS